MVESGLGICHVFKRELDIIFVSWLEVVKRIQSFVVPLLLGSCGSEYPLVIVLFFRNFKGILGVRNISVLTKVGDFVIEIITERSSFMFVLVTASWRADWVRFSLSISLDEWSIGIGAVGICLGYFPDTIIVLNWSPWTVLLFLNSNISLGHFNIMINSEVWHSVINWVSKTCFLVFILGASTWSANWIWLSI